MIPEARTPVPRLAGMQSMSCFTLFILFLMTASWNMPTHTQQRLLKTAPPAWTQHAQELEVRLYAHHPEPWGSMK